MKIEEIEKEKFYVEYTRNEGYKFKPIISKLKKKEETEEFNNLHLCEFYQLKTPAKMKFLFTYVYPLEYDRITTT